MRILKPTAPAYAALFALLTTGALHAQKTGTTVVQDQKFEELLNDKRKINASITVNDKYKVQIFYGENDKARKALQDFKKEFSDTDGTIVFEAPTYKVWVGSYKSRVDAEKALADIRKKYPYAMLIKPNK
jgi:vancomycin resistance protein YoaR